MAKKVKVYVAEHCVPCVEVKELLSKGRFLINGEEGEAEMIDIESDEGFGEIFDGLDAVPSAFLEGKRCRIRVDHEDNTLLLECDGGDEGA